MMWRTPPGTSSAWRAQSHPCGREPHLGVAEALVELAEDRRLVDDAVVEDDLAVAADHRVVERRDTRVPMRQVYEMFRCTLTPESALQAGTQLQGQFFARLYVGLYFEALGDRARAMEHVTVAAADRFADAGGYMHTVARVHLQVRGLP